MRWALSKVCLSGQMCATDEKRGCKVCRCDAAVREGPDGKPALPPLPGQQQ